MTIRLRRSRADDADHVIAVWIAAVDATHHFLTAEDRIAIEAEVRDFLPSASLWLAVDQDDRPRAFMLLRDAHMDALFVDPASAGRGVGRLLVEHALTEHPTLTADVNAQNEGAIGFYRRMGFVEIGRSALDDSGRPYPLIHLARRQ
ncbi:acetyltransferase [Roseomonas aeriglobus]|nr:acetyltransferase [Roseomonas aeriglobus]